MANTPDVRPVGDLPNEIGRTAARELSNKKIETLTQVSQYSANELKEIHGVGPKAIRILSESMAAKGLSFRA